MNRINEYIEPGVYKDEKGEMVVVLEILHHTWNASACLQEALPEPLVVVRNLMTVGIKGYLTYSYPLAVFKSKFKMV